ncbi:MAG: TIGR01777 family oxidoreductase [Bacteroidetes bacterium]|nr:TIGR01777 family oxidoreductase [Bacteroidota bacterium]
MKNKIVIAGGTGFTGRYLQKRFEDEDYEVIIISRKPGTVQWNDTAALIRALDNAALLINLAGKSVNCRYTEKNKKEILESRTVTTEALGNAILQCSHPPALWINAGTATIYRHAEDRPMTESNGEMGSGFSVYVATSWEQSFFTFQLPKTRMVVLRMAIVLGKDDGVFTRLKNLVRFGLGGKQGNGKQMFSWVHIEDLYRLVVFIQQHDEMSGVINAAAPNPVSNALLMKTLRTQMHRPLGLPTPKWLLKMGAVVIGTETELVLKSRWVLPGKLQQAGFNFQFPEIGNAIADLLH